MKLWYDRVKGEFIKELPDTVVAGRFLTNGAFDYNGHTTLEKGDFLLNDGTDKFHTNNQVGRFSGYDKTDDDTIEFGIIESAILEYQEAIDTGNVGSFLIPDKLLARFELLKFEQLIFDVLKKGHLQEIARRPRMELIYEEHLVPVSRAKKIATSANIHLASHSECWQTRTLTGVIPKKILALESEEQLNIYENRVYVKLLGFIEYYLVKRISEVKKLEDLFNKARNFQEAKNIYFELRKCIYRLWGEGFSKNDEADVAAENGITTLNVLTNMLKKVRTLQNSKLYRILSHNLHVPLKLNMTNVLSHDQHYSHVARLWNIWLETRQVNQVGPEYIYSRNKHIATSYSRYCTDLIKRTLLELGFKNETSNYFHRNGCISLVVSINRNSEIIVSRNNQTLCFIPCFTDSIIKEKTEKTEKNQRIIMSLCRRNNASDRMICSSPTNFYSLELLAVLISEWLAKETFKTLGSELSQIPTSFLDELDVINEEHWAIKKNSILISRPFLSLQPRISAFLHKNNRDISIQKSGEEIKIIAENFDNLLCCPCCGVKADENQWIARDHSCFTINRSNCEHMWEVNRQTDGSRMLVIKPIKIPENCVKNTFELLGRYWITIALKPHNFSNIEVSKTKW